ncbi:hypothetical protein VIGAN_UM013700 [Vigna angularis var. angularis]|uniref:Uncharacterized protein n=1 Tax=Vigna angularis var. angularis TaxID=157739 RepID=A0A0S3TDC3_PHAAN|nr:hypothetical protein VIGAN_UM013700 [Vigna angularis var. angularis]
MPATARTPQPTGWNANNDFSLSSWALSSYRSTSARCGSLPAPLIIIEIGNIMFLAWGFHFVDDRRWLRYRTNEAEEMISFY